MMPRRAPVAHVLALRDFAHRKCGLDNGVENP
jgi:hypothetical protein